MLYLGIIGDMVEMGINGINLMLTVQELNKEIYW
jgi:hypothetical protein